mgnify:CR=1 FL=1
MRRLGSGHLLHLGDKIEDIAAALEAIPAVFADADVEGGFVISAMNRAGASEAVAIAVQFRYEVVMLQNLKDGDLALYGAKVHGLGFGHGTFL